MSQAAFQYILWISTFVGFFLDLIQHKLEH